MPREGAASAQAVRSVVPRHIAHLDWFHMEQRRAGRPGRARLTVPRAAKGAVGPAHEPLKPHVLATARRAGG